MQRSLCEEVAFAVGRQSGGSVTESFELAVKPVKSQWEQKEKGKPGSDTVVVTTSGDAGHHHCFNTLQC